MQQLAQSDSLQWETALHRAADLVKTGRNSKALALLMPLLRQNPESVPVLDIAATCYAQMGDGETASKFLGLILDQQPESARLWGKLASIRATLGDKPGAAEAYQKALAIEPGNVTCLVAYNLLSPFACDGPEAAGLRAVVDNEQHPSNERCLAHFALGHIEQRADHFDLAFEHFAQGNALRQGNYDVGFQEQRVAGQLAARFPEMPEAEPDATGVKLLFVTGMPRSGTTLLESSLTRHSQISSIGESPALSAIASEVRQYVAQKHGDVGWWNWVNRLDGAEIAHFRKRFLTRALGAAPGSVSQQDTVVIDKMPLNCFEMGLARLLLPEAKFLFMSRNPLDVGLSNFIANFASGNRFATGLDTIGHMTGCVYQSVRHYQGVLGAGLRVQSFEALVTAPEAQLRAVLDHVGLPWQDSCLHPEDNSRAVMTASLMQVREKINTGGLGKWRRYEPQLAPLKTALGGEDWINRWQAWDKHAAEAGQFPTAAE